MNQEMLRAYEASGWALVWVPPMKKGPIEDGWQNIHYPIERFGPTDNIGIKLGLPSGGLVDVDLDSDAAVELAPLFLPETATFGRASKRKSHWLYRCATKTARPSRTNVELRSTGLQTVFPGSIHKDTGERIEWTEDCPFPIEIEETALVPAVGRLASASLIARLAPTMQDMRMVHDCILALSGMLWKAGWSEEEAVQLLLAAFEAGTGEPDSGHREGAIRSTFEDVDKERTGYQRFEELVGPLDARALKRALRLTGIESKAAQDLRAGYALNDDGNAQRLVDAHGDGMLFAEGLGWLEWTGTHWEPGKGPWGEALDVGRAMMEQGKLMGGPAGETLERWGRQSGNVSRVEAMLKAASRHPDVAVNVEDLDSDSWLFNVQNGTIDLRTGTLRPHSRDDRITKISPAVFEPNAVAPRFDRFMLEVFRGDRELASYMLRFLGYCLTGETKEQALALWHGPSGGNGKSTLIELVLEIMGDYAGTLAPDLLLDGGSQHPTGLMDLKGKRLMVASELEEGKRWRESLVKRITGGDRIKARLMRENFVEFTPTHKLVVIVNARPIVRGTGRSFWRRMHLVPWLVSFEGREERDLPQKLRAEMSGVLRYMVAGCVAWQTSGLHQPSSMLDAGDDYRISQDVLGQFLEINTNPNPTGHCNRAELYQRFRMWGTMRQEHVPPASAFYRMIEERGYQALKRNGVRGFHGLTICAEIG